MSMTLVMDISNMKGKIERAYPRFVVLLGGLMDTYAVRAQDRARVGAPWTDRTGNARNTLSARAFKQGGGGGRNALGQFTSGQDAQGVILSHGVEYGIYLETMQSGKYRIVMPVLESLLPDAMKDATKLLRLL